MAATEKWLIENECLVYKDNVTLPKRLQLRCLALSIGDFITMSSLFSDHLCCTSGLLTNHDFCTMVIFVSQNELYLLYYAFWPWSFKELVVDYTHIESPCQGSACMKLLLCLHQDVGGGLIFWQTILPMAIHISVNADWRAACCSWEQLVLPILM